MAGSDGSSFLSYRRRKHPLCCEIISRKKGDELLKLQLGGRDLNSFFPHYSGSQITQGCFHRFLSGRFLRDDKRELGT